MRNKNNNKKEIAIIVLLFLGAIAISSFGVARMLENNRPEVENNEYTIEDSLTDEINLLKIENGRYQIIIDRIYEQDSNLVNKAKENLE